MRKMIMMRKMKKMVILIIMLLMLTMGENHMSILRNHQMKDYTVV